MALAVASITPTDQDTAGTAHAVDIDAARIAGDRLITIIGCHSAQTPTGNLPTNHTNLTPAFTTHGDMIASFGRIATADAGDASDWISGSNRRAGAFSYRVTDGEDFAGVNAANGTSETPDPPASGDFPWGSKETLVILAWAMISGARTLDAAPSGYTHPAESPIDFTDGTLFTAYRIVTALSEDAAAADVSASEAWAALANMVEAGAAAGISGALIRRLRDAGVAMMGAFVVTPLALRRGFRQQPSRLWVPA